MLSFISAASISLAALVEGVNRAYEGYVGAFSPESVESYALFVREQNLDLGLSLVALAADGEPVGVAVLGRRGERGWIGDFAIAPPWRGRGEGERLLEALLTGARRAGLRRVRLEVDPRNEAARRLYSRAGFVESRLLWNFSAPVGTSGPSLLERSPGLEVKALPAEALLRWMPNDAVEPAWDHQLPALLAAAGAQTLAAFSVDREAGIVHSRAVEGDVDLLYLGLVDRQDLDTAGALLRGVGGPRGGLLRASYVPADSLFIALWRRLGFREDGYDVEMELSL